MLRGNKAIVTGGSRGIGFSIAKMLAQEGCQVLVTGRNQETIQNASEAIGSNVIPMVWDVSDIRQIGVRFAEAVEQLGGLDILVNNSGIFAQRSEWSPSSLLETTYDEWQQVIDTNQTAVFFTMQAAVKYMVDNGIKGNVLNVSSVAGYEPVYGAYGASKVAAVNLTRGWGKHFAPKGIVINGIAPGPVATEMNHWHEGDSMENKRIPFGRYASSEEIAHLAKYLLSEEAQMVCGETVIIDGAYAIR